MRKVVLLYFLTVAAAQGLAQQVDSLLSVLKNEKLADSLRVKTLVRLSDQFQYIDLKRSFEFCEEALKLANDKKMIKAQTLANMRLSTLYSIRGDYSTAASLNNLALNYAIQLKDSISISTCYNNLGQDYFGLSKYDESYFYFTQCYRVASAFKDSLSMAIALHNISTVFKELGQYDRARNHLRISLNLSLKIKDKDALPYHHDEVGDIYLREGKYDSALIELKTALKLSRAQRLDINELEPQTLLKIADAYHQKEDYQKSLAYYDSTLALQTKNGNEFGVAEAELGRGKVLMKLKKLDEAQGLLEKSAEIAKKINALSLQINSMLNLSKLFELRKDYQKSLEYYKEYKSLEDTLFNQAMQAKLLQDQILFETESRDDKIKALTQLEEFRNKEIKKQELVRNILAVVVALSIIVIFTVYRSGQRRMRINRLLIEHQDDIKKRAAELEQLNQVKDKFFSIISHDLRSPINALSSILDLLSQGHLKPEEFEKLTKELRVQFNHTKTLINNLLDWALLQMDKLKIQPERIRLREMVDENFKLLASLQIKSIQMINEIPASAIALADNNTLNLVFRNLILNAIKFTESGGKITVNVSEDNDNYTISVKDNGVGIAEDVQKILFEKTSGYSTRGTANEKGTGLGLILCKEFIEKNGGKIWLESKIGYGSTFFFTLKKA